VFVQTSENTGLSFSHPLVICSVLQYRQREFHANQQNDMQHCRINCDRVFITVAQSVAMPTVVNMSVTLRSVAMLSVILKSVAMLSIVKLSVLNATCINAE
jgi:hypothetical protein